MAERLTPEERIYQKKRASETMRALHADPTWHAAWKAKNLAGHKRRSDKVKKALLLLKSTED